ncbi:GDSL esterase/lipase At4g28780-like [Coffea arabica]|uniref:GDSL esterase/lipase At4g28780-like n=1 Tax=Coffea arabica TaxID=13443 RepID=A0A6P6TB39_COFAR|nr:GDSL esterase/lipase At4g28780-like [Coffea arabica]
MTGTIWFLLLGLIIAADFGSAEVPAIFIFGDSTADVGTNNYLEGCKAGADNRFYGIDYPHSKPTGRFSNGFNTIDLVVRQLGDFEESPPAFLYLVQNMSCFKSNILHGVNFASGGSGICRETGSRPFTNVVPLGKQIEQFATVRGNMTELLGEAKTESLLANSLYIISVGSNDLLEYVRYDFKNKSSPSLLSNLTFA